MTRPLALALLVVAACGKPPPPTAVPSDVTPHVEADPGPDSGAEPEEEVALPTAEDVLSRAVAAIGGRARLDAVESFHARSSLAVAGHAITAQMELWWKGGDYYLRTDAADVGVSEIWKRGAEIWADDPVQGRRRLTGVEAEQASLGAALSVAGYWEEYFVRAQTLAVRGAVIDVELVGASGAAVVMSFDKQTGLPRRLSRQQATPLGVLEASTTFEDYRDVDGIKHPFRSVTTMATFSTELTVDSLEHGVAIDETRFAPPTPGSAPTSPGPSSATMSR